MNNRKGISEKSGDGLSTAVKMWPTPRAGKTTDEKEESWLKRQVDGKVSTPPLSLAVKMWPTPTSSERSGINPNTGKGEGLSKTVKNWPTPKGSPSGPDFARAGRDGSGGDDLATSVAKYPTPSVMDSAGFCGKPDKGRKGPHSGRTLTGKALELDGRGPHAAKYPTPRSSEYKGVGPLGSSSHHHHLERKYLGATIQEKEKQTGQLNPTWVEWLMGWPMGWTSLEPLTELVWLDWFVDPADMENTDVPRLATGVPDRVNRLKAIGNGQVPLCMATAWGMLN